MRKTGLKKSEKLPSLKGHILVDEMIVFYPNRPKQQSPKILAKHKFHIFADLHNSVFQIPIAKKDWQWLGVFIHSKGFKNYKHSLDELISRILGHELAHGICYAEQENIAVGRQSIHEPSRTGKLS